MKTKQSCNRSAEACLAARGLARKLEPQYRRYSQQARRRLPRESQTQTVGSNNQYEEMRKQMMVHYHMR